MVEKKRAETTAPQQTAPAWAQMEGKALLANLQTYAAEHGISDMHVSPEKEDVRVEIRQHGVLLPLARISKQAYIDFVRQVKFLSKLKLNLTDIPQDGQYTFDAPERTVNVRVATIPSRFGESLTLRLLDPKRGIVPLKQLGFPKEISEQLDALMKLPNGLILITGPTGSGKTTTLYALLNTIVGTSRNIITLEDPVEYELPGIVQSEVDVDHDFDFARGLRSILRHDPNVILVGEIRDIETAQTAVDAALTGHLVLSTLHTNSAVEALPRFMSMGASPYTFAPSIRAVLAQRLVRTVREGCKDCDPADPATYDGVTALPELLVVTPTVRELILQNETADAILKQARSEGFKSMKAWGDLFVEQGRTTRAEVERVTM